MDKQDVGTWDTRDKYEDGNLLKDEKGKAVTEQYWRKVDDGITRIYWLSKEDVLFEHLAAYGGQNWSAFMTVITLLSIIIYFVTSSDSASYVVDILAANGREEPPLLQKIFWAFTEGAAAAALLASAEDDSALKAVQALPIILGLPFTFLLFWICQGLLIVVKEEAGELSLDRKHFGTFLFNFEPMTFIAILLPFVPLAKVGNNTWGGSSVVYMIGFGSVWLVMIIFLCMSGMDRGWATLGGVMYMMMGLFAAACRVGVRNKLGISGDIISDVMACCFAFPCAIGQMAAEDFEMPKAINAEESSEVI
jgi:Cys-rich protein (TIGR01571 family)